MYDKGGYIPAGSVGIVGEIGPELVSGPAMVTGRKQTEDLLGGGGDVTIIVNNNAPAVRVSEQVEDTSEGRVVTLTIDTIKGMIKQGGNDLSRTMESTYGMRRRTY